MEGVNYVLALYPVGKSAVCRSAFLTTWHCNLSAELTKMHSFRPFCWRFCPMGTYNYYLKQEATNDANVFKYSITWVY